MDWAQVALSDHAASSLLQMPALPWKVRRALSPDGRSADRPG